MDNDNISEDQIHTLLGKGEEIQPEAKKPLTPRRFTLRMKLVAGALALLVLFAAFVGFLRSMSQARAAQAAQRQIAAAEPTTQSGAGDSFGAEQRDKANRVKVPGVSYGDDDYSAANDDHPLTPAEKKAIHGKSDDDYGSTGETNNGTNRSGSAGNATARVHQTKYSSAVALDYSSLFDEDEQTKPGKQASEQKGSTEVVARNEAPAQENRPTGQANPEEPQAPAYPLTTTSVDVGPQRDKHGRPLFRIVQGTIIRTVLKNRINGAAAGEMMCLVDTPVWDFDHIHLLVPQGSWIIGKVVQVSGLNQERLLVYFERIVIRYHGELLRSIPLNKTFVGLDQIGETGLRDKVNYHLMRMFAGSAVMSAISAASNVSNSVNSFNTSYSSSYRYSLAQDLGQRGQQFMERFINILPTFIIRENSIVMAYIANDILLPDALAAISE